MRGEEDDSDSGLFALTPSSVLGELIVVDRESDFMTSLLIQPTYEGLIEESIGIHNCNWPEKYRTVLLRFLDHANRVNNM
jgi:hypothetical protein